MKKAEQSARTRQALVDAAIALFGERGYRATSIKAVAEAAGISHGVIPFHFGSKEGLLEAAIEACFARFVAAVFVPLGTDERDFGLGDLGRLFEAQLAFTEAHPEVARFFPVLMAETIGSSPELRHHYVAFHRRLVELGVAWVEEGQRRGTLSKALRPRPTAEAMLALMTGVRLHDLLAGVDRREVFREVSGWLEHGALAPGLPPREIVHDRANEEQRT